MSISTEENVKLICVRYKLSDSLWKVKLKLLRAMRRAERQNHSVNTTISHPLQPWTNHCHTIVDLLADDVLITHSNSRYVVFLTKDGRVCRLKCTSRSELSQKTDNSIASLLSSIRRGSSSAHGVSFQEESDAEYARQLQAEYEAQSHRSLASGAGGLSHHPAYFGRAGSPSTVLEELDREARAYMYLGMPHPWPPETSYRVSPRFSMRDDSPVPIGAFGRDSVVLGAADARSGDSPPPDYSSLFGDRRSSIGPPVQGLGGTGGEAGGTGGQDQSLKGKVVWPEMGTLEWLLCKQNPDSASNDNKFIAMAVLHSEILLVSAESRQLYSWSCSDHTPSSSRQPTVVPHPLSEELGLTSERIALLESSDVRATVVTETGKVATFYDALLRVSVEEEAPSLVQSLTHPAQVFPELEGDSIVQLSVSNFITTAVTSTGKVFWWGLCPKDKDTHTTTSNASSNQDNRMSGGHRPTPSSSRSRSRGTIADGSLVRLKNGPPCGPNSIVYSRSPYGPRVGKTMNIIEHGSLDPKTSVLVKVFKDDYRINSDGTKKTNFMDFDSSSQLLSDLDSNLNYNSLEVWKLSDVVFLDDSPAILGRVITVDHPQAIVDISHSTSESGTLASSSNAKSTLKVFKVSELELCPIDYGDSSPCQSQLRSQQMHQQTKPSLSTSCASEPYRSAPNHGGVSHHVAGTVQHRPVCILAPELSTAHNPSSSSGSAGVPSSLLQQQGTVGTIYGYTPLAVHTTDKGPTMLVERISDSATFIVYSGHSSGGGGALVSTSFVALNSKDSKPNLFTVEEESVPALERGFRVDPVILGYNNASDNDQLQGGIGGSMDTQKGVAAKSMVGVGSKVNRGKAKAGGSASTASTSVKVMEMESQDVAVGATKPSLPQRRSSRKRKLVKNGKNFSTCTTSDDQNVSTKLQAPEKGYKPVVTAAINSPKKTDSSWQYFQSSLPNLHRPPMAKLNSQPLLIWDVNGKVCPLLDGLNLRPVASSRVSGNVALPTMSYRCITSRQHAITKTQNVFILAVVCRAQSLMPAVQSGNVMKVDAILNSLKSGDNCPSFDQETGDGEPTQQDSRESQPHPPKPAETGEEDEDSPVAKRLKLSTSIPALPAESDHHEKQNMGEGSFRGSERLKSLSDIPSEMSFEAELPIVEKSATTSTTTNLQSSNVQQSSVIQEGGSVGDVYPKEKVESLGIFFETTLHNSNVLHVCCQLNESIVGGGGTKATAGGKATAESSILKIPSWLKATPGSPEMSFEERRHSYMFTKKREKGRRRSVKELQAMSLAERKLEILDSLLGCEEIQPIIVKLLSSRNAEGKTPFMTSICSQNYAAALKILDYLEEWSLNQRKQQRQQLQGCTATTLASTESDFFQNAILSPWRNGATPIQALLASLSPFYDISSMHLYVFNLPASYTAQHLLKLFQLRYPSAFKAEILKRERDDDGEGVGSSGDEDREEDGWSSGEDGDDGEEGEGSRRQQGGDTSLLSGLRRAAARRRRGYRRRTTYPGNAGSMHPRRGIVHFSSVVELRAAAKEMNDYRMITTVSRSTGFGQTQSIHYLNVHMESLSDSEDDGDSTIRGLGVSSFSFDDLHPLSRYGNDSLRSNRRGNGLAGSRRKSSRGRTTATSKLSSPILAFQLLQKLLSYQQLVTAQDNARETALSSLVHNSKCLQSLKDLQKSLSSKDNDENSPKYRSQLPGARTPISTSSAMGLGSSTIGMPTTSSGRPIRSFTTLSELMKSQEEETKTALNIDRSIPSSSSPSTSTDPPRPRGTTVMPYVSLADWLDQFFTKIRGTSLEENLPKFLTETQQTLQNISGGSTSSDDNNTDITKTDEGKEELPFKFSKPQEVITSTPKPKVVGQSSASTDSNNAAESFTEKANALLSVAIERKEDTKDVEKPSVASQILKATAPFMKNSSTQRADVGSSTTTTTESSADDQIDAPKSKHLRLGPSMLVGESDSIGMTPRFLSRPSEPSMLECSERNSPEKGQTPCEEHQDSESGQQATESKVDIGAQMLQALVTNWPCIVATVLGFYPPCMTKLSDSDRTGAQEDQGNLSTSCDALQESMEESSIKNCDGSDTILEFSMVHSIDSFVTNLVLNCEDATIDTLVDTIVERMNNAVIKSTDSGNEVDLSLLSESIDFTKPPDEVCALNEHNLALLVGVRFMNSVVRLLGLEHSRVKNAFVEMQQMRLSNTEGRGRGDRDRYSIGRLIAEGSSTFMEYDRSLGGGGGGTERRTTTTRKNVTATVKRILGQFSWLAVHSLSEAAEAASAPVRIGVAKPLGASSVLPEYQSIGRSPYGSHMHAYNGYLPSTSHGSSSQWSLARQLHVRTPQSLAKRRRMERKGTQQSCSTLPADGIILRPCPKDRDGDQGSGGEAGLGGGVVSTMLGGASIHDESFEDDFSDMEGSVTDGNTDIIWGKADLLEQYIQ